ncbi:DUF3801 domain-containing protein [Streptococcus dentiloxodontae]
MDQEQIARRMLDLGKFTGEVFLKSMLYVANEGKDFARDVIANRRFAGETSWNKLAAAKGQNDIKTFLSSEMNLNQLKKYMKELHIGVAFEKRPDGKVDMLFKAKDRALVEKAFERTVDQLTTPGEGQKLTQRLAKSPQNMSLEDKLARFQNQSHELAAQAAANKTKSAAKEKTKGDVSK